MQLALTRWARLLARAVGLELIMVCGVGDPGHRSLNKSMRSVRLYTISEATDDRAVDLELVCDGRSADPNHCALDQGIGHARRSDAD